MKEITRRLYTKPVVLGMSFLLALVLVAGLFVTTKSRAAFTFIAAGNDQFETTGNGETYHNFAASPVPAGFFGAGSDKYTGVVPLVGTPLGAGSDTDTIISRDQNVDGSGTTTLTMKGLSLDSINPISVTYNGGANPENWDVHVSLSDLKASTGSMTINAGGTFDSSLKVWPKFTFTRQSDHLQKVLDTGGSGGLAPTTQAATTIGGGGDGGSVQAIAICRATTTNDFQTVSEARSAHSNRATTSAAATTSTCPPVTLTSTNSPWQICSNGQFCIPKPITEQELLASHNASPPGTKKGLAQ